MSHCTHIDLEDDISARVQTSEPFDTLSPETQDAIMAVVDAAVKRFSMSAEQRSRLRQFRKAFEPGPLSTISWVDEDWWDEQFEAGHPYILAGEGEDMEAWRACGNRWRLLEPSNRPAEEIFVRPHARVQQVGDRVYNYQPVDPETARTIREAIMDEPLWRR